MSFHTEFPGHDDLARAGDELAELLPEPLAPLGRTAYNYRWSWAADGPATFAAIDAERWERWGENPVRLLSEAPRAVLGRAAASADLAERAGRLARLVEDDLGRPWRAGPSTAEHPVAFLCAEFGVHGSLPVYSGGLGVLAGDILKETSDRSLAMVAVGIMYRTCYFHQRIDTTGYQHEYWIDTDPERHPCARVTTPDGRPLEVMVPAGAEELTVGVWRVDVGRVPLYLLDTDVATNSAVGRWVTSRLYEGDRAERLAQYAVLGVGGVRALCAMGIEPALYHLNEGHPVLAAFDLAGRAMAGGRSFDEAWASVRQRMVFTTHTPVSAGNETYGRDVFRQMLGGVGNLIGDPERLVSLGCIHGDDRNEPPGMTPIAIRASRSTNAVSRRHGEVARDMWRPLFEPGADVPIDHVTNGVHIPTWMKGPMRCLLDRHLGADWWSRAGDPATWNAMDGIPDAELWAARGEQRAALVEFVRRRATGDRLRRGEDRPYIEAAEHGFDPDRLTVGFARRIATYKRLHLVSMLPDRALAVIGGERPIQVVFAGKAHPQDEEGKRVIQQVFGLKHIPGVAHRTAFIEDYELGEAAELVGGCDLWVNLPRPPQEASGTSGMKSCMNGGLQLSVLDGWWAEAYDGTNGWAIDGTISDDPAAQDAEHARQLFDLIEREVVPAFHDRDGQGIPRGWLAMVKASMRTNCPRFSASRMLDDYMTRIYREP